MGGYYEKDPIFFSDCRRFSYIILALIHTLSEYLCEMSPLKNFMLMLPHLFYIGTKIEKKVLKNFIAQKETIPL